jgi:hypothetical protein
VSVGYLKMGKVRGAREGGEGGEVSVCGCAETALMWLAAEVICCCSAVAGLYILVCLKCALTYTLTLHAPVLPCVCQCICSGICWQGSLSASWWCHR